MSIRVDLYQGEKLAGVCTFFSTLPEDRLDFLCEPDNLLDAEQVQEIARRLRVLPAVRSGRVGAYRWEEQHRT